MKVSKYPPILYPEYVRKAGTRHGYQTKIFQSEEIFKVCNLILITKYTYLLDIQFMKVFLFGAESLKSTTQAGAQPYGKVWKITSVEHLPFYAPVVFAFLVSSSHYSKSKHRCLIIYSQPTFRPFSWYPRIMSSAKPELAWESIGKHILIDCDLITISSIRIH